MKSQENRLKYLCIKSMRIEKTTNKVSNENIVEK